MKLECLVATSSMGPAQHPTQFDPQPCLEEFRWCSFGHRPANEALHCGIKSVQALSGEVYALWFSYYIVDIYCSIGVQWRFPYWTLLDHISLWLTRFFSVATFSVCWLFWALKTPPSPAVLLLIWRAKAPTWEVAKCQTLRHSFSSSFIDFWFRLISQRQQRKCLESCRQKAFGLPNTLIQLRAWLESWITTLAFGARPRNATSVHSESISKSSPFTTCLTSTNNHLGQSAAAGSMASSSKKRANYKAKELWWEEGRKNTLVHLANLNMLKESHQEKKTPRALDHPVGLRQSARMPQHLHRRKKINRKAPCFLPKPVFSSSILQSLHPKSSQPSEHILST